MTISRRLFNGKLIFTFEEEPNQFGIILPSHLFVAETGGCDRHGRVLLDTQGNVMVRKLWEDGVQISEHKRHLASFYSVVKLHLALASLAQTADLFAHA